MYSHKPGELICKKYLIISYLLNTGLDVGEQLADVTYFIRDLFKWTAVQQSKQSIYQIALILTTSQYNHGSCV